MNLKELLGEDFNPEMTIEDIDALLKGRVLVDKSKLDDALSKLSKTTKELRSTKNSEEEKDGELENIREQMKSMQRERDISKHSSKLLGIGFGEEDATTIATALADGDISQVIEGFSKFSQDLKSEIKKELLQNTKRPEGGSDSKQYKKEDIKNMTLREMQTLKDNDPTAF